jgi:hypothetical protein
MALPGFAITPFKEARLLSGTVIPGSSESHGVSSQRCEPPKGLKIKIIMTHISKLDKVALNLYIRQHVLGPRTPGPIGSLSLIEEFRFEGGGHSKRFTV